MCNKCGITQKKCSCDNRCAPKCDPCSKQPRIMYCGNNIDCLGVDKGDDLMRVVSKIGSWICEYISLEQSSTNISLTEIEPGETCTYGGVTITITDADTDAVLQEYDLCNAGENPETYLTITETEPTEDCPTGGYSFEVRDYTTNNVEEEYFICKTSSTTYFENDNELGTATEFNLQDGENTTIQASISGDKITYQVDVELYESILRADALSLIANNQVVPNKLYRIEDRDIFLQGLTTNSFSRFGNRRQVVPKMECYYTTPTAPMRGVFNPTLHTSIAVGDKFVWGGKVWTATATHTNLTPTSEISLGGGFSQDLLTTWNTPMWFLVEYDIDNDRVIMQKDMYNNVVHYEILTGATQTTDVVDWGQLRIGNGSRRNNTFNAYLNNSIPDNVTIRDNSGKFVTRNRITSSFYDNKVGDVRRNILHNMVDNVGGDVYDNLCTNLDGNVGFFEISGCSGIANVRYNRVTYIRTNTPDDKGGVIFAGTLIQNNTGVEISNNISEVIANNVFSYEIKSNRIKTIQANYADIISRNTPSTPAGVDTSSINANVCPGGISDNKVSSQMFRNTVYSIKDNLDCEIVGNTGSTTEIDANVRCTIRYNITKGLFSQNTDCFFSGNSCTNIVENGVLAEITTPYNIENNVCRSLVRNKKAGNSAEILNNFINGDIGDPMADTSRSSTISDPIVNK